MKAIKAVIFLFAAFIVISSCKKDKMQQGMPITNGKDTVEQRIAIPNGDFDNWYGAGRLKYWSSNSCPECVPPFETDIVQQDTAAYHGKYAAKLVYNEVYPAWLKNTFYVPDHPVNLTAYVKLSMFGADTVSIKIGLYRAAAEVDSGRWIGTASISNYTRIVIPVTQSAMKVDSARITITGGHVKSGNLNTNTVLWVDHLSLR